MTSPTPKGKAVQDGLILLFPFIKGRRLIRPMSTSSYPFWFSQLAACHHFKWHSSPIKKIYCFQRLKQSWKMLYYFCYLR